MLLVLLTALAALICFILALFLVGPVNWVVLGLVFVAAHLVVGPASALPAWRRD